jgi:hypothetical protein
LLKLKNNNTNWLKTNIIAYMLLKITKNRKMCKQSNLNIPRNVSVDAEYSRGGLPEELLHKTYHVKVGY